MGHRPQQAPPLVRQKDPLARRQVEARPHPQVQMGRPYRQRALRLVWLSPAPVRQMDSRLAAESFSAGLRRTPEV